MYLFSIKSLFSPNDDVQAEILAEVSTASKSIYVMIYGFTLAPLVDILIAKHLAGVDVQLVLDHTQAGGHAEVSQLERLKGAGVPYVIGTSPQAHAILHEKGIVIDGEKVITGSYNFSDSAKNQVNHCDFFLSCERATWFTDFFNSLKTWITTNEHY